MNDAPSQAQELFRTLLSDHRPPEEGSFRRLIQDEPDITFFYILLLQQKILPAPHQPSGSQAPYEIKPVSGRPKKLGAQKGHHGSRRPAPDRVDREVEHRLERYPECQNPLRPDRRADAVRVRYIEDLPPDIRPEIVQHILHRDYCPSCRKRVKPVVPDALPHATVGHRLLALTAHWHYYLGLTLSQIVELLNTHLHFPVSEGGRVPMWQNLAERLEPWYVELTEAVQESAVLHADETGWRVNGKTHWLWCFTHPPQVTVYTIDLSRGSPALHRFSKRPTKVCSSPISGPPTTPWNVA